MNKKALSLLAITGIAMSAVSFSASAQPTCGYWTNPSSGLIWNNAYGQCWKSVCFTPAMAVPECDPDLMPTPPAPPPAPFVAPPPKPGPAPAPKPAPAKPAPKPVAEKVTMAADALFDFDKSVIKPDAKSKLDDLADKIKRINLEVVIAIGHTDSIGSDAYNQKLSVRRAEAVKAYLVSKGVEPNRIYTE